jgi:hypothetical protein
LTITYSDTAAAAVLVGRLDGGGSIVVFLYFGSVWQTRVKLAYDVGLAVPGRVMSARTPLTPAPPLAPATQPEPGAGHIDKSVLTIAEPKRLRDKAHLGFVASQACLICGRQPSDPHHLRFAQPRAIGLKVSDEFTVPLCRGHHRQLHQAGNEATWWGHFNLKPLEVAKALWGQTHPKSIDAAGEADATAETGANLSRSNENAPTPPSEA